MQILLGPLTSCDKLKNMTIIALRGDSDSGKSSTLNKLYELMPKSGFGIVHGRRQKDRGEGRSDYYAVVDKNEKKIGLCSYGDTRSIIVKHVSALMNAGCTIIVIACRPSGSSLDAIEDYRNLGCQIEYIEKLKESKKSDEFNAQRLISRINELLSL